MGRRRRPFAARDARALVAAVLALAAALLVAGCSAGSAEQSPSAAAPSAASSLVSSPSGGAQTPRSADQSAALALSRLLLAQKSWAYEPRGDVPDGRGGTDAVVVFAHVFEVRKAEGTVIFDAEQLYVGEPAQREASADGASIQGATYRRNAFRHRQGLPIASGAPVVSAWADTTRAGLWPDVPASVSLGDTTFWLVVERGEIVTAMVWQGY